MRLFHTSRAVMIVLMVLGLGSPSTGAEKGKTTPGEDQEQGTVHTVEAGVSYATNAGTGIQAERQPGQFTIPKGSKGAKLKYSFSDPKSDYTSTKLRGSNIYSVTEKRYMHELDHNPDFALPPGDYKFVVGGSPGASGTLAYTTVPTNDRDPPPTTPPPRGTTKRKPPEKPEKTDKTEDKSTVTVSPGGSKRKVVVELSAEGSQAKYDAWLTVDGNKLTLDIILPVFEGHLSVVKNTWRWEGTLDKGAKGTTVSGKSNYESSSIYKHGHNTRFTVNGTFSATLEGNVLAGSVEDHTAWASNGHPPAWRRKLRWRIEGFVK